MEKYLNNNSILIISHIDDADGMGSVILSKIAFKNIDYLLCQIGEYNDYLNIIKNSHYEQIFICDLSIPENVADEINSLNKNILLFDHHATNTYANKYSYAKVLVELNNRKTCGTELFYDYLINNKLIEETEAINEFVENIRSYDVWDWVKDNNHDAYDLSTLLNIIGPVDFINTFSKKLNKMNHFKFSNMERKMIDLENINTEELIEKVNKSIIIVQINNYKVGIVFSDRKQSIIGNELCKRNPQIDYAMIIDMIDKKVSLRSISTDVSRVAENYGGGGHKLAAGFSLTKENIKDILELIIND